MSCAMLCCTFIFKRVDYTQKRKVTHPKFVSNLYEFLSFVEHKKLY